MKINKIILSAFASIILAGCVGLEQYPTTSFTDENFWNYKENIDATLNLGYNQCWNADVYWGNNILSDDVYGSRHTSEYLNVVTGMATTESGRFSSEWGSCYQELRTVHTALDNLDRISKTIDAETLSRYVAEWRLMRAFTYIRLATWFGDVPLFKTNPTLPESKAAVRTPEAEVWAFIHAELEDIADDLPFNTQLPAAEYGRYTAGTAAALNARAYLLQNDFSNCAAWCRRIMDGEFGTYALEEDYAKLFQTGEYGPESMMTIEFAHDGGVTNILRGWSLTGRLPQSIGYPVGGITNFSPTQELVDCYRKIDGSVAGDVEYEGRDLRFYATIAYNGARIAVPALRSNVTVDQKDGYYTCYTKAADQNNGGNDAYDASQDRTATGYYNVKNYNPELVDKDGNTYKSLMEIRYADVLLMYAESMYETGKMTDAVWNETIRPLRKRAGFVDDYCNMPADNVREAIRNERRVELALEGRRVFDLRRWALLENPSLKSTGAPFLTLQATGAPFLDGGASIVCDNPYNMRYWFAVPQQDRDIVPTLTQNPGW